MMDPRAFAMFVPIVAILSFTYLMAERIKSRRLSRGGDSSETLHRLDALEQELGGVKQELAETQERLDFAERMLAKQKEPGRLGGPAQA